MENDYPFESLLVCPETKQALTRAAKETLDALNARIEKKELSKKNGEIVDAALSDGLLREDGKVLYPIREGIPIMLVEEAVILSV